MNLDEVYQTILSSPRGSSGRGMSYWGDAANCGRLALLKEKHGNMETVEDADEPQALSVGSYYHSLHEVGLRGQASGEVWDQTDTQVADPSFLEAVRLYRAYTKEWGSATQRWHAELLGVEVQIPSTEKGQALSRELFGDVVTGRLDALIYIPESELEAVYQDTNLLLPAGGRYILDHKTAKQRSDKHQWEFTFGLQSITYMHIYNQEHPEAPIQGMIFDQIYKAHKDPSRYPLLTKAGDIKRAASYDAFLAVAHPGEEKVIQALVQLGKDNVAQNRTNPKHCFGGFKPCEFFKNGLCQRY